MAKPGPTTRCAALAALALCAAGPAAAQSYPNPAYPAPYGQPPPAPYAPPSYGYGQPPAYAAPSCCVAPAGMEVAVQLVQAIGASTARVGDTFALRLAAPLILDGQVALEAGAPAVGHVVQASGPGLGGKGAKLVVAADRLMVDGRSVALTGMQLTGAGPHRRGRPGQPGRLDLHAAGLRRLRRARRRHRDSRGRRRQRPRAFDAAVRLRRRPPPQANGGHRRRTRPRTPPRRRPNAPLSPDARHAGTRRQRGLDVARWRSKRVPVGGSRSLSGRETTTGLAESACQQEAKSAELSGSE